MLTSVLEDGDYVFSSPSRTFLSGLDSHDKYGHSGYSMTQTVFATQKILRFGIEANNNETIEKNVKYSLSP